MQYLDTKLGETPNLYKHATLLKFALSFFGQLVDVGHCVWIFNFWLCGQLRAVMKKNWADYEQLLRVFFHIFMCTVVRVAKVVTIHADLLT